MENYNIHIPVVAHGPVTAALLGWFLTDGWNQPSPDLD